MALAISFHSTLPTALPPVLRVRLAGGPLAFVEPATAADPQPWPWTGVVHEVFPAPPDEAEDAGPDRRAPASVLVGWAARHLDENVNRGRARLTVWVGRRIWPYPRVLERAGLLRGSLFIDALSTDTRLWAAELSLRSSAVASVVADGAGFSMTATRRLQLVARASGALMLLARPSRDERQLSAAGARWRVRPAPAPDDAPRWTVQLLRCKGVRPVPFGSHEQHPVWTLSWEGARASMRLVEPLDAHADSSRAAPLFGGIPADVADRAPYAAVAAG